MVRVTPGQYSLLQENAKKTTLREPEAPRQKKRAEDLPENQLEARIVGYLQAHHWTVTRQHVGTAYQRMSTRVMFSIPKGPADWRAERAVIPKGQRVGPDTNFLCELFYFETKAPGKRPEPHQELWATQRQLTGFTATWFDDYEVFVRWYRKRYGMSGGDTPIDSFTKRPAGRGGA
jgi:hypothetical protein